jgi:hydrogenase maturation protease
MTKIAIIGYGNTLRGDDAIGWLAAEELSTRIDDPRVKLIRKHQLNPELAETISRFDAVLFVDATNEGTPGEVRCHKVEPRLHDSGLTHSASPAALLVLARELYGRAPRGYLVTLCGESYDLRERLSPRIERAMPRLVSTVEAKTWELLA